MAEPEWRLIREEARPGAMNMALDEVAAETAAAGGPRTLRVYRWSPGALSLGYAQPFETVSARVCERDGIDVTRRPTGGGGIYHDAFGDISYSIVAPADELPGDLMAAYSRLLTPVLDAFERMGVKAGLAEEERPAIHEPACYLRGLDPAHDVAVGGRKISGNAQYRRRDAVIQHGSLTYARATDRHLAVFGDPVPPEAFEGRVASIREQSGITRAQAVSAVEDALREWAGAEAGSWTDDELAAARDRAREKYDSADWVERSL